MAGQTGLPHEGTFPCPRPVQVSTLSITRARAVKRRPSGTVLARTGHAPCLGHREPEAAPAEGSGGQPGPLEGQLAQGYQHSLHAREQAWSYASARDKKLEGRNESNLPEDLVYTVLQLLNLPLWGRERPLFPSRPPPSPNSAMAPLNHHARNTAKQNLICDNCQSKSLFQWN